MATLEDTPTALMPVTGKSQIEGIPAEYDDGKQWLRNGFRRQPRAVIVGLLLANTGVWLALWGALIGAFVGLLIGTGLVTKTSGSFYSQAASHAVGPFSVFGGLVLGALAGFGYVLKLFIWDSPLQFLGALVGAAVAAYIIVLLMVAYERVWLRMRGYRRLTRDEVRRVAPLVKQIAEAMDLDGLPRFAAVSSNMPGAWAHARTIVISTGLLQLLDDGELRAVLTHELHHWRSGDVVGQRMLWAASWPLALTVNIAHRLGGMGGQNSSQYLGILRIVAWVVGWPAWVSVRYIITPVYAHTSRAYEYAADAAARNLGDAANMITALQKMSVYDNARTGWEAALMASHPPTALRIEALEVPKPDDAMYTEDELSGPKWADAKRILWPF